MSDTDGLLAEASAESDDNQQEQQESTISHVETPPDSEPQTVDEVTVAAEDEEMEFVRPDWYPEKFWNEDDGPDLENLVKSYNALLTGKSYKLNNLVLDSEDNYHYDIDHIYKCCWFCKQIKRNIFSQIIFEKMMKIGKCTLSTLKDNL